MGDGPPAPLADLLGTLSLATHTSRRVWLRYRDWSGRESERRVDPYGVVYHAGLWYMAGCCHLRGDLRVFRCDRLLRLEVRQETFSRPPDVDVLGVVLRALAMTPKTWPVEVMLALPLELARQRVPASLARLEDPGRPTAAAPRL